MFSHGFLDVPMSFPMEFLEISHVFPVFPMENLRFGHGHGGHGHGAKECISLRCPLGRDTPSATPWPWRIATLGSSTVCFFFFGMFSNGWSIYMAMDQYLLIPFLGGWTSIYQLFWGSLGTRVLTHSHIYIYITIYILPSGSLMVFNGIYSYLMELYSDSMGYKWDIPSGDLT